MARQYVQSSNVEWVDHNPANLELTVRFKSGVTYTYHDVPEHKFQALLDAESTGKHLQQSIIPNHRARQH